MPQCCSVPMCANKTGGHKFPTRDKIRLKQWLAAIRRDKFTPTKNSLVCKSHFTADNYELPKDSVLKNPRPVLKKIAVPSKFPWNDQSSSMHQKNKERHQGRLVRNENKIGVQVHVNIEKDKDDTFLLETTNCCEDEIKLENKLKDIGIQSYLGEDNDHKTLKKCLKNKNKRKNSSIENVLDITNAAEPQFYTGFQDYEHIRVVKVKKMGTKSTVRLRTRGTAYKCDLCGRKLMSPDALKAHQRTAHNIIKGKSKPDPKPVRITKIPKPKPIKKAPSPPKVALKAKNTEKETEKPKQTEQTQVKKTNVQFECPRCFRVFLTYFPAHKHIQKFHCVNKQGYKVLPNSPDLIQPVRFELCLKCNRKVRSIQAHVCETANITADETQSFMCTACEERFSNLKNFDDHVVRMHGDVVESMFFPTTAEFSKWKEEMEEQTKVNYSVLDKYDLKRYYHCNHVKDNPNKSNTTYFCPSTIVIQEFSKGIQVHFYKTHHKHFFQEYKLSNKYKKYSITSFMKKSEGYKNLDNVKSNDENDLYLQFKTLMEGIVLDAAKLNITTLKTLIGKALDLTSILTNYDEEGEDNVVDIKNNKSMTDSQISKELEEQVSLAKRKLEESDTIDKKRPKLKISTSTNDISSPKIINSFSLADKVEKNIQIDENEIKTEDHISSFNDSYKDFVEKNFPETEITKRTRNEKKQVMKTKIGQFKPNLSPKEDVRKSIRLSIEKPKVDLEYEVKEQKDGCNILILKI